MSASVEVHSQIAAKLHAKAVQYETRWFGEEPVYPDFRVSQEDTTGNTSSIRSAENSEEEVDVICEEANRLCGLGIWSYSQAEELITSLQLRQSYGASVVFFHLSALLARQHDILSMSPLPEDCPKNALDASFFSGKETLCGSDVVGQRSSSAASTPVALPNNANALRSIQRAQEELEAIKSSKSFSNVVVGVICGPQRYPPKKEMGSSIGGVDEDLHHHRTKKQDRLSTWWSTAEGRKRIQEELQLASFLSFGAVLVPPLHPPCVCGSEVLPSSPLPSDASIRPSSSVTASVHPPDEEHHLSSLAERMHEKPEETPSVPVLQQEPPHEGKERTKEDVEDWEDRYVSCMASDVLYSFIQVNCHTQIWVEVELAVVRDASLSASSFSSSPSSSSSVCRTALPLHESSTCGSSVAHEEREHRISFSPTTSTAPLSAVASRSPPLGDTTWRSRRQYQYLREALLYGYDPLTYYPLTPRDITRTRTRDGQSPLSPTNALEDSVTAVVDQERRYYTPIRREALGVVHPFLRWPSSWIPKREAIGCLHADPSTVSRSICKGSNGEGVAYPLSPLRVSSAWLGEPIAGFEVHPSILFPHAEELHDSVKHSFPTPSTSRFFSSSSSSPPFRTLSSKKHASPSTLPEDEEDTFVQDVERLQRAFPPSSQLWGRSLPEYLSPLHFVAELLRRSAIPVLTTRLLASSLCSQDENVADHISFSHPFCCCCSSCAPPSPLLPSYFFPCFVRLQYLYQRLVCDVDRLPFKSYENTLQLPLQPLADALSSEIYDIFERDRGKYQQYYRAMEAYISDWCDGARKPLDPALLVEPLSLPSRPHRSAVRPHVFLSRVKASRVSPTLIVKGEKNISEGEDSTVHSAPPTMYITILGCGRGPLIAECLRACNAYGVRAVIFALDKNKAAAFYTAWRWKTDASCVALLQRGSTSGAMREEMGQPPGKTGKDPIALAPSFPQAAKDKDGCPFLFASSSSSSSSPAAVLPPHVVHVIHADGRFLFDHRSQLSLPAEFGWCDVVVSELLGSLGDNELSPECIEGFYAQLHLFWQHKNIPPNPFLVSIPSSYTAWAAPVHSTKFEVALTETTMKGLTVCPPSSPDRYAAVPHQLLVSHLMQGLLLAPPQPLWTFQHFSPTTAPMIVSTSSPFSSNEGSHKGETTSVMPPTGSTTTTPFPPSSSSTSISFPHDKDGLRKPFFREACCLFRIPCDRRLSGFMGFFEAVLYEPWSEKRERPFHMATNTLHCHRCDSGSGCGGSMRNERSFTLCTLPDWHTEGLFSWFPCIFPLPNSFSNECVMTDADSPAGTRRMDVLTDRLISFRTQRCTNESERRVWYQWEVNEWQEGRKAPEKERNADDVGQRIGVVSSEEGSGSTAHDPCMGCTSVGTGREERCCKGGQKLMVNHTGWAASIFY